MFAIPQQLVSAISKGEVMTIPVNEPLFEGREKELLCECIDTGWISSDGRFVTLFEEMFSDYIGVKHGIAVCNGTAALELAVACLGLEQGSEVIVPTFTIISCINAIVRNGLVPVLVDAERNTWNMDVNKVEERISARTKAIMPVHIYGHPTDMDPLKKLAEKHDLIIIEDAAEAHGALYRGKKCGSMGQVSVFSFYANKIITTGEGGMVLTDDDGLAERARSLRNLCFQEKKRFYHSDLGYNFRMTNLQGAVGIAQMEKIEELIQKKIQQGRRFRQRLKDVKSIILQEQKEWAAPVYWVNGILIDETVPKDAEDLARLLMKKGIQSRPFFWPMHEQPIFKKMGLFKNESYPVSELLSRRGLYLPGGMALTEEQIQKTCDAVIELLISF